MELFKSKDEYFELNERVQNLFGKGEEEELKHFDWSEKIQYMPKVREQKDCGSCYVIATMSMIDFRLRIKLER